MASKKLTKSNDKVFSGVLGGVADYFNFDATLVRIIFAALVVFTGYFPMGILYIIAAVVMPDAPTHHEYEFKDDSRKDITPNRFDDDI